VYAFFGWLLEVSYYYFKTKTFVNRGFLIGPYVPIYGLSVLSLHLLLNPYINNFNSLNIYYIGLIFAAIIIVSTLLELVGGMGLYALFGIRWWDYSEEKFNYKGYVCLKFSLYWGILGTLFYSIIHLGVIVPMIESLNPTTLRILVLFLVPLLMVDYYLTIRSLVNFKSLLNDLKVRLDMIEEFALEIKEHLPKGLLQKIDQLKAHERFKHFHAKFEDVKSKLYQIKQKNFSDDISVLSDIHKDLTKTRLFRAFPDLKIPFKHSSKKRDSNG
jgi:uncharacterized membrane protein